MKRFWRNNSLSILMLGMFFVAFMVAQTCSGWLEENSVGGYMTSSRFWFESFQNWQSEFLAIGCMVIFSIYLRQRGSPESKPVDAAHSATGG